MDTAPEELDFIRELRTRSHAEGGIFWTRDGELAVFHPDAAQKISALNFSDLTLPDKLGDVLRGRTGDPVSWKQLRSVWTTQLRRLSEPEEIGRLDDRMRVLLDARLDRPLDLTWAAQEICTQALLPTVVLGLSAADMARLLRDQTFKLTRLVRTRSTDETIWKEVRSILIQVSAGLVVRREIRGRARGRRPRQLDMADPIVDLLPELGMDRAVDAVTTILTAIAGPPGAAAACLLYELTRRPDWAARLAGELEPITPEQLARMPAQVAPATHRFVKETLRMWSPPLLMTRSVRTEIHCEHADLKPGQNYLLSTYLIHHDPRHWKNPDTFDPDRWLPEADPKPNASGCYVPFGWAPKACLGAGLGTTQLMVLCHLVLTRYRVQATAPEKVRMVLAAVPLPVNFHGTISRR
jgi:cytochrome P450